MSEIEQEKLRAVIVDDEILARQGLSMRLSKFSQVEIVANCRNGRDTLAAIVEHEPDLVFVDIQMPGMTGIEMISEIQTDILPMLIFVTAYDSFAIDAFNHHAIDYLLKPVELERLSEAINKAMIQKVQKSVINEKQRLLKLVMNITGKSESAIGELLDNKEELLDHPDRLAIKDGSSVTLVPVRDIDWIDAAGDYMCVHVEGKTHIMRTTMKDLEAKLDSSIFQRVHRSTMVNLHRIEKISSHINGEFNLTLSCGSSLKMSRTYKEKVKHFF